jgi:hypothetical protein
VQSYVTKFRDDFEQHIREKRCGLALTPAEITVA